MKIRTLLLFLVTLPALLLPGGLTFCLCWCAEMRAATAESSCCASATAPVESCCNKSTVSDGLTGDGGSVLIAACDGCHPLALPSEEVKQSESARTELTTTALAFVEFAPLIGLLELPRFERSMRWTGARSTAPPGKFRSLPLLI